MAWHPRFVPRPARILIALSGAASLAVLTSCSPDVLVVGVKSGSGTVVFEVGYDGRPADIETPGSAARARVGHPWFPLTPGRYTDFRILRYPAAEPTYVRATLGEPEEFFGRLATPWVYGAVPGLPVDESLEGLRQYYSVDDDGALRMHGSENDGIMSYMEPPIRHLPPDPAPGAAWIDTTYFRSFFPGMVPIFAGAQTYASTLSDRAFLDLPGAPVHALRRAQVIETYDGPVGSAAAASALSGLDGAALAAALLDGESPEIVRSAARGGRRDRPALDPLRDRPALDPSRDRPALDAEKGIWFARNQGFVARDYPHGVGESNINITTYERIGSGFGPVPAAQTTP